MGKVVHSKNGGHCLLQTALWPAAFFKMQTWVVVADLLRNLLGTDSGVGLGGTWIRLAAWLLEEPRPQCGLCAAPHPRRFNVGIWAVGA